MNQFTVKLGKVAVVVAAESKAEVVAAVAEISKRATVEKYEAGQVEPVAVGDLAAVLARPD